MTNKVDFSIYVGRFQPFHKGHEAAVKSALNFSKHVIIVCGSSFLPRTLRNPWTFAEREQMIRACFPDHAEQITVLPLRDTLYNNEAWIWMLQKGVHQVIRNKCSLTHSEPTVGIVCTSKHHVLEYSKLFPQWRNLDTSNPEKITGTEIRDAFFETDPKPSTPYQVVPTPVEKILQAFSTKKEYSALVEEKIFLDKYKKGWEQSPYPPTFVTTDAVVCQSGHILMVKRKAHPGKNLFALPGGFIGHNETLLTACLRELRTETRLKIPEPVLKGSLRSSKTFDYPFRSLRGRTITHAFYFELSHDHKLPEVKGGQDAKHAFWLPLSQLDSTQIFEDHFSIIQDLLGIYMN